MKYRLHRSRLHYDAKYEITRDRYIYKEIDSYSSHAQILNWIDEEKPAEVLEVGTATGYLTSEMVKRGCSVTGVEIDREMAGLSEKYCRKLLVGDIESMDLSGLGRFDAIVFGDVLEHLKDPGALLTRVAAILNPGGKILISFPNVANIWVRLNLLFGRFEYSRVGILDEGHLRFFTLKTAVQLANRSGFDVESMQVTPVPLPLIFPSMSKGRTLSFVHWLNWLMAKLRKTLFGYQFILVCRPRP
jgi:SAM-dependent methyltransferase